MTRFLTPLLILLLAAALRFQALARDVRFHPDEALFAMFSRSAAVQGDWLLPGSLDKPPLTIYANAISMMLFGVTPLPNGVLTLGVHAGEFAARIPNTFASILLVAVVYVLAKSVVRFQPSGVSHPLSVKKLTPVVAMLLAALSPYALAFSATAFTDGLMLLCITLALWGASRGKAFQAGLWLILGFWCKQQALLTLPLLIAVVVSRKRQVPRRLLSVLLPILLGVGLLFAWDAARGQTTSMWALAVANNDPGRLIRPDELLSRLSAWWEYGQYLFGNGLLTVGLIILIGIRVGGRNILRPDERHAESRTFDLILGVYVLAYFLLNWLIAFNIYDRYLLLILPPLWILAARAIVWIEEKLTQRFSGSTVQRKVFSSAALFLCFCVLCLSSFQAAEGHLPIGGDHGEHTGIDQLGAYLDSKPLGAIIYDHWLGWELGYYVGPWSDKRKVYYPTPGALVADAVLQPDPAPRYFVAPDDMNFQPWLDALQRTRFKVQLIYDQPPFVVYELIPPS